MVDLEPGGAKRASFSAVDPIFSFPRAFQAFFGARKTRALLAAKGRGEDFVNRTFGLMGPGPIRVLSFVERPSQGKPCRYKGARIGYGVVKSG